MRSNLIINLIDMLFLHISCCLRCKALRTYLGLFTIVTSDLVLFICHLSILRITKFGESASTGASIMPKFTESQRNPTMSEPEKAINLIQFSCSYRMEVIVSRFSWEEDKLSWKEIHIFLNTFWGSEIHGDPTQQRERHEYLLEWGMCIYMWRYSLPRLVVIHSELVECPIPLKEVIRDFSYVLFRNLYDLIGLVKCEMSEFLFDS